MTETTDNIIEAFKMYVVLSTLDEINTPIHDRISEQVALNPINIAVKHGNDELYYFQLEQQSNIIANYLINLGVQPEDCIGIHLNKSILLPVIVLGILKAGCVYVPLATNLPTQRIQAIVKNAEITHVFTNQETNFKEVETIQAKDIFSSIKKPIKGNPNVKISENHAAYIIYTSGSTGDPKGVVVEHKSLTHYLDWYLDDLQSQTNVNLPLTSSISFAAGVTQLFSALLLGRTLHIIDEDTVKNPSLLLNWYHQNANFGLYCVPTLWEEMISYIEEHNISNAPECLYLSGEALSKSLADRTFKKFPNISIWNLYGPTEATANVSYYEVQNGKDIFLGKPIRGAKIFILDDNLNQVPNGQEGYIYIASLALARSYKNKDELTQKSFIKEHNITNSKGFAIYNTGDIGKYTKNNELIFLGRKDQQVKIRGYRIELSEVEKHLGHLSGIRQVVCKEITDQHQKKLITAFIVISNPNLTVNKIRQGLSKSLPDYMIPERFVYLDEMPKLPNGKINRKLLKIEKVQQRPKMSYTKAAAKTKNEQRILSIWETVLEIKNLGMTDNFFDLGGNSLKIIKLVNLINIEFNCELEFGEVWKTPTPLALLKIVEEKITTPQENLISNIKAYEHKNRVPLTFNQTGMWFVLQSQPDQTAYNMLFTISLKGIIREPKIKQALKNVVQKHDILRSRFKIENNNPVREIINGTPIDFSTLDISEKTAKEIDFLESELKDHLLSKKVNLSEDSLISFKLVKYTNQHHVIFVSVHHIIFDGMSINIFTDDFYNEYNHLENSLDTKNTTKLTYTYSDYEQWMKKNYFNGSFSKSENFWKKKLEKANHYLNFPIDNARPKIQSYKGDNKQLKIEGDTFKLLNSFNKKHKVTSFITLLSVFKSILYRYSNETDILVGVPFANRIKKEVDPIIGLFVNTVVYRSEFNKNTQFINLLNTIKEYTLEAINHQHYPFGKVVERLNPERSISYNPLFQIMFAYHDTLKQFTTHNNVKITTEEIYNKASKFDLDVEAQEYKDAIVINFNYNTALFEDFTIHKIIEHFNYFLKEIIANPEEKISNYSLEDTPKLNTKLSIWNATNANYPKTCLHTYLETYAKITPNAICLESNEGTLTYAEVNKKANQLSSILIKKGVCSENIIGVLTDRSFEMMIAIFAILKSGGAYLPMNPNTPKERIKHMVNDSKTSIILTKRTHKNILETSSELIFIEDESNFTNDHIHNPSVTITPNNLAYVIYTSGSTGNPKGVMIEHHSVINRIVWMQKKYTITSSDVIMQKTAYTFDVSVWELFLGTFIGAKTHLLPVNGEKNTETIIETIQNYNISIMHFVPSMLNLLLEHVEEYNINISAFNNLTTVFTSGEALEKYHVKRFYEKIGNRDNLNLINLYGPTEATIDVSHFDCTHEKEYRKIPIGKPIDNTQLYIVDENNQPLPERIPGELCISGVNLARGYINNPDLTAQKFIQAPFNNTRMYKTGDWARWLPDGNIEYLGRIDHQVKIRGFRIELGEIENCLHEIPNIETAVVVVKEINYDDVRIVAYYILKNENEKVNLKAHLRSYLPDYMIPSVFVPLKEIPLLSNGKLNIKALPEPFLGKSQVIGEREYLNTYEKGLAKIWSDLLLHDAFSLEDNFYDVGGYSFLLIKMKSFIDKQFDVDIKIVDLFQYSTIKTLAEVIASKNIQNQRTAISSRAENQRKSLLNRRNHGQRKNYR